MTQRTDAMRADLVAQQASIIEDPHRWVSVCGSRRAGKTTGFSMASIIAGEERPGFMTIIMAPEKLWLIQNYWGKAESGIQATAARYGLDLETNENKLTWTHPNGSRGVLMGLHDVKSVEALQGMEANRYILDEAHRIRKDLYTLAMDKMISPQAVSRKAQVIVGGNPGDVCSGDFWKATDPGPQAKKAGGRCTPYPAMAGLTDKEKAAAWSFHHVTMQGNTALPHQWEEALALKDRNGWPDDHPTWVQQYLGLWVWNPAAFRFNYTPLDAVTPSGRGLISIGVWLTAGQAHLVALSYDVDTGRASLAWEGTSDSAQDEVYKLCKRAEAVTEEPPAWAMLGGEPPVSDTLYTWLEQRGMAFARYRRTERATLIGMARGAFTAGQLQIPADSVLGQQLAGATKTEEPGFEMTDALILALAQLPAPPVEVNSPEPEPARGPWIPGWLPLKLKGAESEEPKGRSWADFLKAGLDPGEDL